MDNSLQNKTMVSFPLFEGKREQGKGKEHPVVKTQEETSWNAQIEPITQHSQALCEPQKSQREKPNPAEEEEAGKIQAAEEREVQRTIKHSQRTPVQQSRVIEEHQRMLESGL